jgi:uncharacterized membrane protein
MPDLSLIEWALTLSVLALAAVFKPWSMLRNRPLQNPWLAALVVLPWGWGAAAATSSGAVLQISGACLLVLMVGWPLACWTLVPVALLGTWMGGQPLAGAVDSLLWFGLAPASLALATGLAIRRWLPNHLFVYILGRGFFATALAVCTAGSVHALLHGSPQGLALADMLVGYWLIGWGEAFTTGMLVATMVAFRPQWLATYSDQRYLPV